MYKIKGLEAVIRLLDGACIPFSNENSDYKEYKQWLLDGNLPKPEFTDAEILKRIQQDITSTIQEMLDTKAQSMRYDNMMSARSYAGYPNPFQAEAQSLAVWGALCWQKAGEINTDVESEKRPMPTVDEVIAEMPEL